MPVIQPSSVSFSYFILAVPMHEYLGKHLFMSSTFPVLVLNGPCFFQQCSYKCTMHIWRKIVEMLIH